MLPLLLLAVVARDAAAQEAPVFRNPFADLTESDERAGVLGKMIESKWFRLSGYFRMRGELIHDFDLDRGPLPDGTPLWPANSASPAAKTVYTSNMRLRVQPELLLGDIARLVVQVDCLDNVVLGSTPRGFPPVAMAPEVSGSSSQDAPEAGVNSWSGSIRLKKIWAELALPFGIVVAGRMGHNWGLGMVANSGNGIDDDYDDSVDRVGFVTSVEDHFLAIAYDFNATGQTSATSTNPTGQPVNLSNKDDVNTLSFAVLRFLPPEIVRMKTRAGKVVFNYGAVVSWRRQAEEVPSYYLLGIAGGDRTYADSEWVSRRVDMILSDAWLRLNVQRLRIEMEFAYVWGRAGNTSMIPGIEIPELSMNQWGLVGQIEWQPAAEVPLTVLAETGVASGDSAWGFGAYPSTTKVKGVAGDLDAPQYALPGDTSVNNFRFHPNYHIDKILWRRIIGTFTDGAYVKARLRYEPMKELRADLSAVYSRTLNAESAPGLAKPLGVEVDAELTWFLGWGVEMSAAYAVLFPLAGFRNVILGADPKPAQLAEVRLAFRF